MQFAIGQRILLTAAITLLGAPTLWAWNKAGHMVSGAMAYDLLAKEHPDTLSKVLVILKQHPQFKELWQRKLERLDEDQRDRAIFMLAARWADDIRRNPDYDKPPWHYVDYPYKPADQPESVGTAPPPEPNAEIAFRANVDVLKRDSTPAEKAVALCWLFHIIGDIHQPLHTISLFTTDYPAPEGDQGATKMFVRVKKETEPISMHFLWDGLVIGSDDFGDTRNRAIELRLTLPKEKLAELAPSVTPASFELWVQEGVVLAKDAVYRQGKVTGSPKKEEAPALPEDYVGVAKPIGERRLTVAGHRLAAMLVQVVP